MHARILVVEDDPRIGGSVVAGLIRAGFDAVLAADGCAGATLLANETFDLVVLDLMLPGRSGFELLRAWEGRHSVPVVVLSARTDLEDRLRVFELGAVDFLPKPFYVEELLVRIRARLGATPAAVPRQVLTFEGCELDRDARQARLDGVDLGLTTHEFNVLWVLAAAPGRAFTRSQLAERALPEDGERLERTVDSHVYRIRRKLGHAGGRLQTVFGVGYRWDGA